MDVAVVPVAHRIRMRRRDPKPRENRPALVPLQVRHRRHHHPAVERARKFHRCVFVQERVRRLVV